MTKLKERKDKKNKKVCFAASTGGHFEQIMMLKPLMEKYDSFIVTERTDYAMETGDEKVYYLKQVNRKEKGKLFKMAYDALQSLKIFLREKPDIVISTGVLATVPICLISKLCGKKLIYIESFAKITSPTETGELMYKFADQFYVQWESMLDIYPQAICKGGIY